MDKEPEFVIEAQEITKSFGHLEALRGASLKVRPGEVLSLLGDNGAGKSTLVKCISGVNQPDSGRLLFGGEPVDVLSPKHAQDLGIQTVYQDLALAPDISVLENMFLGREIVRRGWLGRIGVLSRSRMHRETNEALVKVGITLKSLRTPVRDLSGGQRQAVAVARAVKWASRAIMMDEPTAALGARQRELVYATIRSAVEQGLAVVVVSHDIPAMLGLADRVSIMRHGTVVLDADASSLKPSDVMAYMLGTHDEVA